MSLCFLTCLYTSRGRWPRASCLSSAPEEADATRRLLEKPALEAPITAQGPRVDLGGAEPELGWTEAGRILSHLPPGTSGKSPEAENAGLVQASPGAASAPPHPGVEPWSRPTEGGVSTAGQRGAGHWDSPLAAES